MYIIVGLGNPGREYADTRHNMGFMALDILAARHNIDIRKENFRSVYGEGQTGRPGADHRQPFRRVGRQDRHQGFMTRARVDQTGGDFADEDPIETRLIAADAGVDLIGAIVLRF